MNNSFRQSIRDNVVKRVTTGGGSSNSNPTPARVVDVILDDTHPEWEKFGREAGIGTIKYKLLNSAYSNSSNTSLPSAIPLVSHIRHIPLVNEIVLLITAPSEGLGSSTANTKTYYTDIVSIWNHPHHAGYPEADQELKLGNNFSELSDINPMLPFEGDIIVEGRQGQSLRFSTSYKDKTPWEASEEGKPITIISNGQISTQEGYSLITEDINQDSSSMYLTSNQKLPISTASTKFNSYRKESPVEPQEYTEAQVVLNSNRLVFNSRKDHILLSSNKSINLNSIDSVNIDSPETVLQSGKVYLGDKNATEPVLKGNLTVDLLEDLLSELRTIGTKLLTAANAGGPVISVQDAGASLIESTTRIQTQLSSLKSTKTFTD